MAIMPPFLYYLLIFTFLTLSSNPVFSRQYLSLNENPNFDSDIALFGDAELINGGSSVQLTPPIPSSSGLLIQNKSLKFLKSNPVGFSTDFIFSMSSPHNGQADGLALVFGLSREKPYLEIIRFSGNHFGGEVCDRLTNLSSMNLDLSSGVKFHSWIDYEVSLKRIEVRLGKLGSPRPYDPVLAYQIDLSEMWKEEEVFVGLSSSSGNSVQSTCVYSWRFRVRAVSKWMHSQPMNPHALLNERVEQKTEHRESFCHSGVLSGLIIGIGCGALVALVLLSLWAILVDRNVRTPAVDYVCPVDFRYEKINVVVDNSFENVKKQGIYSVM